MKFSRATNMREHVVKNHAKTKPFKCATCSKGFTEMGHLRLHERAVHQGQRPHACELCSRGFSTGTNLRTHVRVVHPIVKPAPGQESVQEAEAAAEAARVAADARKKPRAHTQIREQGDHISSGLPLPPREASRCAEALCSGKKDIADDEGNLRRIGNYLCLTCGGAYGSLGTVRTHSKRDHGIVIPLPGTEASRSKATKRSRPAKAKQTLAATTAPSSTAAEAASASFSEQDAAAAAVRAAVIPLHAGAYAAQRPRLELDALSWSDPTVPLPHPSTMSTRSANAAPHSNGLTVHAVPTSMAGFADIQSHHAALSLPMFQLTHSQMMQAQLHPTHQPGHFRMQPSLTVSTAAGSYPLLHPPSGTPPASAAVAHSHAAGTSAQLQHPGYGPASINTESGLREAIAAAIVPQPTLGSGATGVVDTALFSYILQTPAGTDGVAHHHQFAPHAAAIPTATATAAPAAAAASEDGFLAQQVPGHHAGVPSSRSPALGGDLVLPSPVGSADDGLHMFNDELE
jgi:DNA-directed RNA polymerase subunit RPC12/RpoP